MSEITNFCYTEPLCLKRKTTAEFSDREVDFVVNEPYRIKYEYKPTKCAEDCEKTLIVPAGLVTDLVTVPCGRVGRGLAAALVGIERTGPHLRGNHHSRLPVRCMAASGAKECSRSLQGILAFCR